ncbi:MULTISPECIES: DNA starvation/stationary phase protection protein [unclassified Crossiella]|uniref:Dps family protein n=1 Tax=unclassified Crossiella TaxID=2620835 RepID=UPI001FFFBFF3|nr:MULTISPECIES: DNA starvation/stationary phase protection protein [unclassified Crossiella]MCK2237629.1 DNA starvation/stationary phase protection protein [Crossiella sp. S99.2]MCK2254915.1 DNA starvation/stationary phase protection protein [Crossiella sp. S99.1]
MTTSPITSPLGQAERERTGEVLQAALVDLIDLSLVAKQAHWNVVGRQFRDVHLQLDELVTAARGYSDQVAERAAAIGVSPDGRVTTVAETTGVPAFPANWKQDTEVIGAIVTTLGTLVQRMRVRIDATDKTDLVTQDLIIEITGKLEEAHWMWQAQLA